LDPKARIIAIFNTSSEVLEMVRDSLQQAGMQAVVAHIDDLKRGRLDMIQFVEEHKPDVIVYDVAPPYDTNWTFLRLMRNSKVMQGRAFVVTTTNKRALEGADRPQRRGRAALQAVRPAADRRRLHSGF
jgi:CheY-like chemotaxis protein